MKTQKIIVALALGGLIGLGAGCGQKEEQTPPTPAPSAPPRAASEVQKQAEAQKPAAEAAATDATAASNAQADGLIAQARTLIENKDYKGAGALIQELSKLKLTPEQQKLYDDLKAQLQKALANNAAAEASKAAGGVLNGTK